jgi:pimeloyl-ACP methyl ester carboxylesterase
LSENLRYDEDGTTPGIDGTPIYYGVRGRGEPTIVLCDGIGCDGFAWRYLQPALAEHHRVVHWHYRGHGRSGTPVDRERNRIEDLAADLERVLDEVRAKNVVLIGHSMGTQVVLEMYRRRPDPTAALVLVCGSYGRVTQTFHGTDVLHQVLPALVETVRRHPEITRAIWGRVPAKLAYAMARIGGEVNRETIREEDFRAYWEHLTVIDPEIFLAMLQQAGHHSAEDLLPSIDVPTLILAAEKDTFTPPDIARWMADAIPGAELEMMRGGSHAAPVEQPLLVELRIEKFLAERLGTRDQQGATT